MDCWYIGCVCNFTCLGNSQGSPYNVWNGYSTEYPTALEAGIDIDTFHIKWTDNQIQEGDTSAQINLHAYGDGYVLMYKIISFRSTVKTGGALQKFRNILDSKGSEEKESK